MPGTVVLQRVDQDDANLSVERKEGEPGFDGCAFFD
jgi:hypothetical protein